MQAVRKLQALSVVVPCYNEEAVIPETIRQLREMLSGNGWQFEVLLVDDGSTDSTWQQIEEIAKNDSRFRGIRFARNFGHQNAVSAGLDMSSGDATVLIDADLQDPPRVILQFVDKWEAGYDVVYGVRSHRHGESKFKKTTAAAFYRTLNKLSDVPIPLDTGDFRLMDKAVVKAVSEMPEKSRFLRGMISWVGFNQTAVSYERDQRFAGESKYPLRKMLQFALDGLLSFSTKPLRFSIMLGFAAAAMSIVGVAYVVYIRLATNSWVPGWAALGIAILMFSSVQLITVGILGEYVGRIFKQVQGRPIYLVSDRTVEIE